jgi:hypothetical protein
MSVSLVRTLPVGLLPAVPFVTPPASTAVSVSAAETGASLTRVISISRDCVLLLASPSLTVKLIVRVVVSGCSLVLV